mmetsp:Transcript_24933/g.41332  ORF Transcript_24933/g.41332 Transcript_24933/m.41332 type:complete len:456 (+) Transcript_24933:168-1535(+)
MTHKPSHDDLIAQMTAEMDSVRILPDSHMTGTTPVSTAKKVAQQPPVPQQQKQQQQQQRRRLPTKRPNALYRFLLTNRRMGGHMIVMYLVWMAEFIQTYLPPLANIYTSLMTLLFGAAAAYGEYDDNHDSSSSTTTTTTQNGYQVNDQYAAFVSSKRTGSNRKQVSKRADEEAADQLQRVGRGARYKHLSITFMQRHGIGVYATADPSTSTHHGQTATANNDNEEWGNNNNNNKANDTDASSSVLLMGHSMGSFATLEMASKLPEDVSVTVVLVAPALGLSPRKETNSSPPSAVGDFVQSYISGPPVRYFLRRLVGINGFWKRGLQSVWGDSELVTDSDALRFQWPSIGKGWEHGLLRFAHAMAGVSDGQDLVKLVANRPNTRIVVILGEKDKVISRSTINKIFSPYPNIPIVEVEGSGHDPFEENGDGFIDLVEKVLGEQPAKLADEDKLVGPE